MPGSLEGSATARSAQRPTIVRADRTILEAWIDELILNDATAASPASELRREICRWLDAATPCPDELLVARFGWSKHSASDAANLLVNNIDQTACAFRDAAITGMRADGRRDPR
jgi:hypothetical protein